MRLPIRLLLPFLLPFVLSACAPAGNGTDAALPRPGPYVGGAAGGGF